ncbi:tRNA (adenosine(37)-N6)-threonylcarbamoyltransferase complex ATPase subunit type 1 TsaE [Deferribacterales bacterium Es71-Z0220]|uniref:tRNA (adenosine(37)-N6)-threonylcarbamoyltransferase complex ATPase subunit type 1 TsaE n=1 Tax=Deferrivibrio essentukiensis TaxID=2880922 RepID=UPI001F618F43|nr:tRNA (adenosine(37)-N6)-threonylcarbamoyltransferase complex ATPase subunit type 1 TsaE [Deferrivibrio essentukiensis]MCB4205173.1 tRNA (adenosine(37)-N6)-threonylcarbamoyltransferase complex ATPase subunit type 1 TsaE [Deferrivibrio essentukiensis]
MNYCKKSLSLEDTKEIAKWVYNLLVSEKRGTIFLNGEMGAGKTTFTKYLAEYFGCADGSSSPTFTILNTYESKKGKRLLHFDLYRIESIEELEQTGFFEYIEDDAIAVIEWADKLDLREYFDDIVEIKIEKDKNARIFNVIY